MCTCGLRDGVEAPQIEAQEKYPREHTPKTGRKHTVRACHAPSPPPPLPRPPSPHVRVHMHFNVRLELPKALIKRKSQRELTGRNTQRSGCHTTLRGSAPPPPGGCYLV